MDWWLHFFSFIGVCILTVEKKKNDNEEDIVVVGATMGRRRTRASREAIKRKRASAGLGETSRKKVVTEKSVEIDIYEPSPDAQNTIDAIKDVVKPTVKITVPGSVAEEMSIAGGVPANVIEGSNTAAHNDVIVDVTETNLSQRE